MKKQWQSKLIAWAFGVHGVLDEQRMAVLGRAAINAVLALVAFEFIVAIAGVMLPIHHFTDAYYIQLIVQLMGVLTIIAVTVSWSVYKAGISDREVSAADYSSAKRRVTIKWVALTPVLALAEHLLISLLSLSQRALTTSLLDGSQFWHCCLWAVLFAVLMGVSQRRRIKVVEEDL